MAKRDPDGITLVSDGGQSLQVQWKQPGLRGKWKEVSNTVGDLGSLVKDKRITWQKSCKESLKREQEVVVLAEELKAQGRANETPHTS